VRPGHKLTTDFLPIHYRKRERQAHNQPGALCFFLVHFQYSFSTPLPTKPPDQHLTKTRHLYLSKTYPKPIPIQNFGAFLLDTPPYRNSRVCECAPHAGLKVIGCRDLPMPPPTLCLAWLKVCAKFSEFQVLSGSLIVWDYQPLGDCMGFPVRLP
jgi:hypothetical protein